MRHATAAAESHNGAGAKGICDEATHSILVQGLVELRRLQSPEAQSQRSQHFCGFFLESLQQLPS